MSVFTIQIPDGRKLKIEAPDEAAAIKGAQEWAGANPASQQQPNQVTPSNFTPGTETGYSPGAMGDNPMSQGAVPDYGPGDTGNMLDRVEAGFGGMVNSVPIVGPPLMGGLERLKASVHGVPLETIQAEEEANRQANPNATTIGNVAGSVAPYAIAGQFAVPARMLGMTGATLPAGAPIAAKGLDLLGRGAAAFGSNMAIGTTDSMVRGASLPDALQQNLLPSAVVGSLPFAGAAVRGVAKAVPKVANWATGNVIPMARDLLNTGKAGQKAVGRAMNADVGQAILPTEEALALQNGLDLRNIDRGGPATRKLARVAKSSTPEAEAALVGAVDRGAPGVDTAGFLTKLVGGSADDLALRQGIEDTGRVVNSRAYKTAESSPAAQSIFTPDLQQLMQAPEFMDAVKTAERASRTNAALHGGQPVQSPFLFAPDGTISMRAGVTPSLKFWDQVQRELRKASEKLGPKEKTAAATYGQLRDRLLGILDTTVPEFQTARRGAAAFFGAEDMLDAGRKFALQPRNLPEAKAVIDKLTPAERKAFEIGAASSAIDVLKSKDTFASIKQVFGSPAQREFWRSTLGTARADQLEAFVKVQGIMEESKRAVLGGSQTHDLLMGSGMVMGGFAANQIAPGNGLSTAAYILGAARLARGTAGRYVDRKVLESAAQLLASGDKAALNKVVVNTAMSPRWKAAVDALMTSMHGLTRGAVVAGVPALAANQ